MAGSVNKVILLGNVGKDPEIRNTQGGGKIVNVTLATSESWSDRASGERKEKTEWHRVVVFNEKLADAIERFVKKGSKIYVEGSLQTRKWTDQQGQERYSTEVVVSKFGGQVTFLDSAGGDGGNRAGGSYSGGQSQAGGRSPGGGPRAKTPAGDLDDEIPFAPEKR